MRYEIQSNKGLRSPQTGEEGEIEENKIVKPTKVPQAQELVERDASSGLAAKAWSMQMAARFPDLLPKAVWKNRTLASADSSGTSYAAASEDVKQVASGDPGSVQRVRSIDLQLRLREQEKPSAPTFLKEVVEVLRNRKDSVVKLLTDSEQDGWTIPVFAAASEHPGVHLAAFVTEGSQQRIAIFWIASKSLLGRLFVIDASPTHLKLFLPPDEEDVDLEEIDCCISIDLDSNYELRVDAVKLLVG